MLALATSLLCDTCNRYERRMVYVMAIVEEMAQWIQSVKIEDIPPDVIELAQAQKRSVVAAIYASLGDSASQRVLAAVKEWSAPGNVPMAGTDLSVRAEDALYAATVLSIAQDYDDYLCFAHTGHSAVLVPAIVGYESGSTGIEQLITQVIANEIAGRLGGTCLIGRQNGQMWSFVHSAAAAAVCSRLMRLSVKQTAHALALSLYAPPRATTPGFFMPDSKLITAAEPTCAGLRAARLASVGVTGPLDVLDSSFGFLHAFSEAPLRGALSGLGEVWVTRTISIKPYPGCAYVDTLIDAILSLDIDDSDMISGVRIETSVLSYVMDLMSKPYARLNGHRQPDSEYDELAGIDALPTPVTMTFSLRWMAALALLNGGVSYTDLQSDQLAKNAVRLRKIAGNTTVVHDPALSVEAAESFENILPTKSVATDAGIGRLLRAGVVLGRERPQGMNELEVARIAARMVKGIARKTAARAAARMPVAPSGVLDRIGGDPGYRRSSSHYDTMTNSASQRVDAKQSWWDASAIDSFTMKFPSRVIVRLKDGSELLAKADVPKGAAGNRENGPTEVAKDKLIACTRGNLDGSSLAKLDLAITGNGSDLATYFPK